MMQNGSGHKVEKTENQLKFKLVKQYIFPKESLLLTGRDYGA